MAKFTYEDALAGKCEHWQVGTEVPEVAPEVPERTQNEDPNMASFVKSALLAVGGEEAFIAEAKKNPTALFQAVLKMGVLQAAKNETVPPPQLDTLTDADIQSMSTLDLKKAVLRYCGVTKKSELG